MRITRTEQPYPSIVAINQEANEIERVLEKFRRSRILVDLRPVAPRNDEEFESAMSRYRQKLFRGNGRMAILVQTAVGALQVKRHMREDGLQAEVFQSEEEALSYLDTVQPDSAPRFSLPPSIPLFRMPSRTG